MDSATRERLMYASVNQDTATALPRADVAAYVDDLVDIVDSDTGYVLRVTLTMALRRPPVAEGVVLVEDDIVDYLLANPDEQGVLAASLSTLTPLS